MAGTASAEVDPDPALGPEDAVAAAPGIDKVAAMKPDFCGGYKGNFNSWEHRTWISDLAKFDSISGVQGLRFVIANAACQHPSDAQRQKWVASWRQALLNREGISEAQDRALLRYALLDDDAQAAARTKACAGLRLEDGAALPVVDAAMVKFLAFQCGVPSMGGIWDQLNPGKAQLSVNNFGYWIDRALQPPSELYRAVYVLTCLGSFDPRKFDLPSIKASDLKQPEAAGAYALCGMDARSFDPGKFEKELAQTTTDGFALAHARETYYFAKKLGERLTEGYRALAAKDPDWKRVMFEAPEQAIAKWGQLAQKHQSVLDASYAFEDKFFATVNKKQLKGCGPALRKQFETFMGSDKSQTNQDVLDRLSGPIGFTVLHALAVCEVYEGRFQVAGAYHTQLVARGVRGLRRGPRVEAAIAAIDAAESLKEDGFPDLASPFGTLFPSPANNLNDYNNGGREGFFSVAEDWASSKGWKGIKGNNQGEVASVKKGSDGTVVSFKPVSWKEVMQSCRETNKIDSIDDGGRIIYRQLCKDVGTRTVSYTEPAVLIPNDLADGIRAGVVLGFSYDDGDAPRAAFPKQVYTSKGSQTLSNVFGIAGTFKAAHAGGAGAANEDGEASSKTKGKQKGRGSGKSHR